MGDGGEGWDKVELPAIAEEGDALGRPAGSALWPERFPVEALERIRRKLGSYSFAALYQQRPFPREGTLFKRHWFTRFIDRPPDGLRWARGYDLAVSVSDSADYTASFRCAIDRSGNLIIADGFRARIEFPDQRRYVIERLREERNTAHGIESALHGKAFVQDLRRYVRVAGAPLRAVRAKDDKFTRALAWAARAEEGKVVLVRGPWNQELIEEACRFTGKGGTHDDQIDAISLAVEMLAGSGGRGHFFD
jgi:predicted phage terminase large subunit-like protein